LKKRLVGVLIDEAATDCRRLRVLPRLVQRAGRIPQFARVPLDGVRQPDPRMPPPVVARLRRRWKHRVGEGARRDDDQIGIVGLGVEDLRAALGTEVERVLLLVRLVGDPGVALEAAGDRNLLGLECRLHAECASGSPLAREAVADRRREGLALDFEPQLTAVACRFTRDHTHEPKVAGFGRR
jgi:hypothetical protein